MAFEDVKQYFENVGMEDRVIELEKSSATVEEAANVIGCKPSQIAKTLSFLVDGKPILIVANVTFKEYLSVKEKKKSKHKRVAVKNKKRKKKVAKTSSNKKQNTNSSKSKKARSIKSKKKRVSSKTSGGYITYTLKKTDTLWNLAKKYYGSGDKYKKIYNANKSLQQGYKLKPGSTIRIPKK